MSWLSTAGAGIMTEQDVSRSCMGQQRIDFDSPEGSNPSYHIHGIVLFFGVTTRTTTEYRGLTLSAAQAKATALGNASTYAVFEKQFGSTGFYAQLLVEETSRTVSIRRVDASGQYAVTVVETSVTMPGATKVEEVS